MTSGVGGKRSEPAAESVVPLSHSHGPYPTTDDHGHLVQFYESDPVLVASVSAFLGAGLGAGEGAIVIATATHREALEHRLNAQGINVAGVMARNQLQMLDARETLAKFMIKGMPDEDLFIKVIGGAVAKASVGHPGMRAFGEMVALLWEDHNPEAAIALEKFWNTLGKTLAFSLLCAYPIRGFGDSSQGKMFTRVCQEHSAIIPVETYQENAPVADRIRAVAVLQQKALALEAEIVERRRIEEALRMATGELASQVDELKSLHEAGSRHQAQLSESERRFRTMADSAPVMIWLAGPEGHRNYVNKPWLEFTGNTLEQELSRPSGDGIHPDDVTAAREALRIAREGKTGFRSEFRYRRADGAWRWLINTGTPCRSESGAYLGFIGSCIDVTESKDAEEHLRQAQKMEAVGRLAGGIAHDFNNLLTAINGYSEMALAMVTDDGTSLKEFLGEIKRSGERAASLTQQLLAYSRKQILAPTVFDLNETVRDMDRMLRRLIGEHLRMECILEPGLGMIQADPGQIQQIILNLVLNARDAMPGGGCLTLQTSNVVPDGKESADHRPHVLLAVRDTGTGMTPEVKARIFEPFFTTKEVGRGTGLGLSSVYGIIRQSGGFVHVDSEPGKGSAFLIYLPIAAERSGAAGADTGAAAQTAGRHHETILLVEDEETVRKFIQRTLLAQGYEVLEAKDGEVALRIGESHPKIDLLLTDVVMPNLNGTMLAERLKLIHPGMGTLFMSGYTDTVFLPGGILDAGSRFLQKPFGQADLLQKVKDLLDARARS